MYVLQTTLYSSSSATSKPSSALNAFASGMIVARGACSAKTMQQMRSQVRFLQSYQCQTHTHKHVQSQRNKRKHTQTINATSSPVVPQEIGRASCRARVC